MTYLILIAIKLFQNVAYCIYNILKWKTALFYNFNCKFLSKLWRSNLGIIISIKKMTEILPFNCIQSMYISIQANYKLVKTIIISISFFSSQVFLEYIFICILIVSFLASYSFEFLQFKRQIKIKNSEPLCYLINERFVRSSIIIWSGF